MTQARRDANSELRGGTRSAAMLSEINWASLSMLASTGILDGGVCARLAAAMHDIDAARTAPGGEPGAAPAASSDYLDYEQRLEAIAGPDASLLHLGRSRQDIAATISRMNLRLDALSAHALLLDARSAFVELARLHVNTLVPTYTHGVQAQPTTFAHYLLAFADAFGRQLSRIERAYQTINQCPLGAAAVTTSSFPVDRTQLAGLLGFDGVIENAYDANHIASVDSCLELAAAMAGCAVQVSQFAQDIHAACASARPWISLDGESLVGRSSLMPQKRNPAALEQLRAQSALLLSESQAPYYLAHNVRTGMFDYRAYDPLARRRQEDLFGLLKQVVQGMRVDTAAARAEIDSEFSTLTELADRLFQVGKVPFRRGHEFSSQLADLARREGSTLKGLAHGEVAALYMQKCGEPFPLGEQELRDCFDAHSMVFRRRGLGGPQVGEVDRMLGDSLAGLARQAAWRQEKATALERANAGLREPWRTSATAGR
jgi:argininosuccinate lyase